MKKLLFIGSIGCLLLTGCKKEPLIHLDEQVQASIEAKQQEATSHESEEMAQNESQVDQSSTQPQDNQTSIEPIAVTLDPSSWTKIDQAGVLNLVDYLPNKINQLKVMSDGRQTVEQYVEFIDNNQVAMQVIEKTSEKTEHRWYRWNTQQIVWFASSEDMFYFDNQINQKITQPTNDLILLQAPLQVGNVWNYDGEHVSEITAIYQEAQIADQTYTSVIEVTSQLDNDTIWKTYFAPEVGLLASVINDSSWVVQQAVEDAKWDQPITVFESTQVSDNIAQMETTQQVLQWETNQEPAEVWSAFFKKMHWMTEEIMLNQVIKLDDQQVQIDFTPGIVNAMNQHPHKEYGVIPAIVKTVSAYYNVPYVKLTVNGAALLPDHLMFPENGIWQAEGDYEVESTSAESISSNELNGELTEESIEESIEESSLTNPISE